METPKLIYPFPWGAQSCPLPWLPCTPPIPILLIVVLIDRALIAGGLAEEPHGKLCVACVEFPVWCHRGVYLSECHTRPSRAASPALSAAQTAQGKRLAGGNEARADLHLLGWTIATSIADSRCHGEHHSTALPPFAHLEDGGNNPHHLFARLL